MHLGKALKRVDALLVEDVAAAEKNLVLILEVLAADDTLPKRVLAGPAPLMDILCSSQHRAGGEPLN